jgi:hypothetical protein
MGINPAVFIANMYLFWYEYHSVAALNTTVVLRAVREGFSDPGSTAPFPYHTLTEGSLLLDPVSSPLLLAEAVSVQDVVGVVISCFAVTRRFVDDLFSVLNPLLSHLLYASQQLGPIRGIYDLELNLAPASRTEPSMRQVI